MFATHANYPPTFQLYLALTRPASDPSVMPEARAAAESMKDRLGLTDAAQRLSALRNRPVPPSGLVEMSESITRDYARPRRWSRPK